MKNIIGRGIPKTRYYLSIIFTISAACVLVMLIGGVIMGGIAASKFGIGPVLYPSYYALSVAARILFVVAYISFALTMTIYTRNAITGFIFGLLIPNIPKILEMVLAFKNLTLISIFSKSLYICRLFMRRQMIYHHFCYVSLC